MNDQPHTHRIDTDYLYLSGMITYGDQRGYLHLMRSRTPSYWPDWYLRRRTRRLIAKLIRDHDKASMPKPPRVRGDISAKIARELNEKLLGDQWGSKQLEEL